MESESQIVRPDEVMAALSANVERMEARLEAAASLVERAVALLEERESEVRKLVAAVEAHPEPGREAELEQKLQAAEQRIAELRAQLETRTEIRTETGMGPGSAAQPSARKTIPAATAQFLTRHGIELESVEAGALDAALSGLSLEQRIAVKAQLLRAGVVG
jgi:DNA repair exonuclease SbcCD ATPase subunit